MIGNCPPCGIIYNWDTLPLLRNAGCPNCNAPLIRATTITRGKRIWRKPIVIVRKDTP